MNNTFFKKLYKNEPYKAKLGIVYMEPDLAEEIVNKTYDQTLINNKECVIIIINALSGTLAQATREKIPNARIICVEYFPFEIKHLNKMGFETVDINEDVNNFSIEYMNSKLQKKIKKNKIACVMGNPPYQGNTRHSGSSLWPSFIAKSFQLSAIVALVVPVRWCAHTSNMSINTSASNKKRKIKLFNYYMQHHLVVANIAECSKFFPDAGFSDRYFSYFIYDNNYSGETKIVSPEQTFYWNVSETKQLPYNLTTKMSFTISQLVDQYVSKYGNISNRVTQKDKYQSDGERRLLIGVGRFVPYSKMPRRIDEGSLVQGDDWNVRRIINNEKLQYTNYTVKINDVDSNIILMIFNSKLFQYLGHIYDPKDTYGPSFFKALPNIDYTQFDGMNQSEVDHRLFQMIGIDKIQNAVEHITSTLKQL